MLLIRVTFFWQSAVNRSQVFNYLPFSHHSLTRFTPISTINCGFTPSKTMESRRTLKQRFFYLDKPKFPCINLNILFFIVSQSLLITKLKLDWLFSQSTWHISVQCHVTYYGFLLLAVSMDLKFNLNDAIVSFFLVNCAVTPQLTSVCLFYQNHRHLTWSTFIFLGSLLLNSYNSCSFVFALAAHGYISSANCK